MTFIRRVLAVVGIAGLVSLVIKMRQESAEATDSENWHKVDPTDIA